MNTEEKLGTGIHYNHVDKDDKHYFGGFLNIAQNNINQVFGEFCTRLNLQYDKNTHNIISKYFTDEMSHSDWEKRIEILKEYFPVIEYLDLPITDYVFEKYNRNEKEYKKRVYFRKNLQNLLKSINDLRNYYTHYYHSPIVIEDCVFDFLDSTLLKTCVTVKKKKMKNDKTRQTLKTSIQAELEDLEKLKIEQLKKNPKAKLGDKEGIRNAILNDAFHHLIYSDKGVHELSNYHKARLSDNNDGGNQVPISQSGLIFLLSLFLTKKETEQLKANIKGFKAKVIGENDVLSKKNNSLKYMATHWVFSFLCYKGLKRRVSTSFDKLTLLIQMIDELSKVPHEVYQTFSEPGKEEFLEDINEFVQESTEDDKSLKGSTVVHPVIRKRYEDKFNYFAIRFLDEFANFPTLKFQVFAGIYEHDSRQKEIKGSNYISERVVKEKINIFGKLSEVYKYKSDYFKKNKDEVEWYLFPNPGYNFIANNIHIYIDLYKKGDEARNVQLEINKLSKKLKPEGYEKRKLRKTKEDIINIIYENKIKYNEPTALFSLNELPALLYELLINKKTGAELEDILVKKIVERHNTIKNYDTNQNLSNSQITKNLKKSISTQDSVDTDKLLRAIDTEIDITNEKLNLIKFNREETRKNDKFGRPVRKYVFYTNELGQEATWLTYDLLRFMPKSAKEHWKGYQHSELQRLLAYYDQHKKDAKNVLSANWNLNAAPIWGAEIDKAFRFNDFDKFYEEYLNNRKNTLVGFAETIKNTKTAPNKIIKKALKEIFIVFSKRLYTISSSEKQKEELLAKPTVFPRGIFDKKPTFIQGMKVDDAPDMYADWYSYCYDKSHQFQKFYNFKRDCKDLFKVYEIENKESKINKKGLTTQQKFELFSKKQDLIIKKVKHKDIFTKHMVDFLFSELLNQESDIILEDLYQTKHERSENQKEANKQKDRSLGDNSENIFNENFIWNKTIAISLLNNQLYEPKVRLIDIGKFKKLETDEKVIRLLSYDSSKIWSKLELEDELENRKDSYERIRREKILKVIQEFEKLILEKHDATDDNHPKEFESNGNPKFRKYISNGILAKNTEISELDLNWLNEINNLEVVDINILESKDEIIKKAYILILLRNKIGHNQLPHKDALGIMQTFYKKEENETYGAYFYGITQQIINEFEKINKYNYELS